MLFRGNEVIIFANAEGEKYHVMKPSESAGGERPALPLRWEWAPECTWPGLPVIEDRVRCYAANSGGTAVTTAPLFNGVVFC